MPTGPYLTLPQNHQQFSLSRHHLLGKTFLTIIMSMTKAHSSLCNSQKPWQVHVKYSRLIQMMAKYKKLQSQNNYLRQWLPRQESYLHHLLDREAPPEDRRCVICKQDGVYKCQDYLGEPLYCMGYYRSQHHSNPFHWMS
jgi:hypothetical protein